MAYEVVTEVADLSVSSTMGEDCFSFGLIEVDVGCCCDHEEEEG